MRSYADLGIAYYTIKENNDDKLCGKCSEQDGKTYLISEYEHEKTAPPFHPNCRGTIEPSGKPTNQIINEFENSIPDVYNEYMENRTASSGGDLLEAKRKYAVTMPDLAEIMLYVKAAENGDYDTAENLNNKEYRSAYDRYLKEAESRNETAVSMNMFLNTVLPVQTQIQKNRDNAYTDFFDGFKTAHEILKEQLDYINDALPWASLAAIAAAPAAAPVTAPMAVSIAAYLEFIEVCSDTMAAAADLIEKLLTDNLLEEETSLSTYEDELYNVFGDLLYMAESIIGRKSGSALKVSREVYSSLENESLDETKKAVSEIGGQVLKKELSDLAKDAAEDAKEEKEKIKDVISKLSRQIDDSVVNNEENNNSKKNNSNKADLGNKLDYLFGKASGNKHNIERSKSMRTELEKIGIHDTPFGREYLSNHLNDILKDSTTISNVEIRSYIAKELPGKPIVEYKATTRESLLMGPGRAVKIESIWDGNRLLTVIVKGGN